MKRSTIAVTVLPYALLVAFALYMLFLARDFAVERAGARLGPEVWPTMVLLLLIVAAVAGALNALALGRRRAAGLTDLATSMSGGISAPPDPDQPLNEVSNSRLFAGIAATVGYVLAIGILGFTISTFLLLFALTWIGGYRRPIFAALISIIGAFGFFVVFQKVVYVSLPLGIGIFGQFSSVMLTLAGVK